MNSIGRTFLLEGQLEVPFDRRVRRCIRRAEENADVARKAEMALIAPPRQIEHWPDPKFGVIEGGDIAKVRNVAEELGPGGEAVDNREFELGGIVEARARRAILAEGLLEDGIEGQAQIVIAKFGKWAELCCVCHALLEPEIHRPKGTEDGIALGIASSSR